ncbi:MAG: thermonuclease family protein [Acidimicrobiales bacterium]
MTHRPAAVALGSALALLVAACVGGGSVVDEEPGRAEVVRVVDGDTIVVRIGRGEETVRLLGIDTPETKDPRAPVECFGREASARTEALLPPATAVRLVRDVEARDRYDRLLAYVYRVDDGAFVNLALAAEGYAAAFTYPPNVAHADELVAAAAAARRAGRGLWSACGGPDTPA